METSITDQAAASNVGVKQRLLLNQKDEKYSNAVRDFRDRLLKFTGGVGTHLRAAMQMVEHADKPKSMSEKPAAGQHDGRRPRCMSRYRKMSPQTSSQ